MNNDRTSVRMVALLLAGTLTVVVALCHRAVGAAVGVGAVVGTLHDELIGR
jgi:hypothetical protein